MKKTITNLSLVMLMLVAIALPKKSNACVDYATQVWVTCEYAVNQSNDCITEVVIRVHNLRLFGGNPNDFCSCAVNSYTDFFSNIQYVAFVDSGTNNPIGGFLPYERDIKADNAWENVWNSGDWSGFVAGVSQAGLLPGKAVELIIRATPPDGFKISAVKDSVLKSSQLGTDEWDDDNETLANSHQNLVWLASGAAPTMTMKDADYFVQYDKDMRTKLSVENMYANSLLVYPNPSNGIFNIQLLQNEQIEQLEIYNSSGQIVKRLVGNRNSFSLEGLQPGVYIVHARTKGALYQQRVTLLN